MTIMYEVQKNLGALGSHPWGWEVVYSVKLSPPLIWSLWRILSPGQMVWLFVGGGSFT